MGAPTVATTSRNLGGPEGIAESSTAPRTFHVREQVARFVDWLELEAAARGRATRVQERPGVGRKPTTGCAAQSFPHSGTWNGPRLESRSRCRCRAASSRYGRLAAAAIQGGRPSASWNRSISHMGRQSKSL